MEKFRVVNPDGSLNGTATWRDTPFILMVAAFKKGLYEPDPVGSTEHFFGWWRDQLNAYTTTQIVNFIKPSFSLQEVLDNIRDNGEIGWQEALVLVAKKAIDAGYYAPVTGTPAEFVDRMRVLCNTYTPEQVVRFLSDEH